MAINRNLPCIGLLAILLLFVSCSRESTTDSETTDPTEPSTAQSEQSAPPTTSSFDVRDQPSSEARAQPSSEARAGEPSTAALEVQTIGDVPEWTRPYLRVRSVSPMAYFLAGVGSTEEGRETLRQFMIQNGGLDPNDPDSVATFEAMLERPTELPELGTVCFEHRLRTNDLVRVPDLEPAGYIVTIELDRNYAQHPGRALASVELDDTYDSHVLSSANVNLVAGQLATMELAFQIPEPPERVDLHGTVTLPAEWRDCKGQRRILPLTTLELELLDTPFYETSKWWIRARASGELPSEGPIVYSFREGDLQPGRYRSAHVSPVCDH